MSGRKEGKNAGICFGFMFCFILIAIFYTLQVLHKHIQEYIIMQYEDRIFRLEING